MKAVFFEKHGDIDVLKFADLDEPSPGPGQALIKVKAVALNHLDIWVRRGWKGLRLEMPHIGGSDIAGEIVAVNADSHWQPGARVIINPGVTTTADEWTRRGDHSVSPGYKIIGEQLRGGMAEYVVVPIKNVFRLPEDIDYTDAAATLLTGTTCWRMLFGRGNLRAGESVLIVGAGGGVNSLAITLCKLAGATVYALTSSKTKEDRARELGADEVINYQDCPDWPVEVMKRSRGRGVDIVIDNVGQATMEKSMRAVARGGRILTVGNTSGYTIKYDNRLVFAKQLSIIGSTMGNGQDFIDAQHFLWRNNIKPAIDHVAPLSEGIEMIKRLEDGEQFGKIVLTP